MTPIKVKAKMFWYKNMISAYAAHIRVRDLPMIDGFMVAKVPKKGSLSEETLNKLGETYAKSTKFATGLKRPNTFGERYVVVFSTSPYLHVYYESQIPDILNVG